MEGITDLMDMSLSKLGIGDGKGSLASCSLWGHQDSGTTEQLNGTELEEGMDFMFCFQKGIF